MAVIEHIDKIQLYGTFLEEYLHLRMLSFVEALNQEKFDKFKYDKSNSFIKFVKFYRLQNFLDFLDVKISLCTVQHAYKLMLPMLNAYSCFN